MDSPSEIIIVDAPCPMCKSYDRQLLVGGMHDIEDRVPGVYAISRCAGCGLVYLSTRPSATSLPACYPKNYHVHDLVRSKPIPKFLYGVRMWFRASNLLKRLDRGCRSLLEIGCGDGTFLDVLLGKMTSDCTLTGIDLLAQPRRHPGLTILRGEFEKMEFGTTFDAVVMYGALEHLADPLDSLRLISRLLTPHGVLIGDVPNWESRWRKIFPRHWSGLQIPRHQTMFSPQSLEQMLNLAGYDLVGLRYIYDPGDLSVSLCNWIVERLHLQTLPRQVWFFFPAAVLSAPLVALINALTRDSGNMEFTARKRSVASVLSPVPPANDCEVSSGSSASPK